MSNNEEKMKVTWKEFFAMCLAGYRVMFPIYLTLIAAIVGAYILLRIVF